MKMRLDFVTNSSSVSYIVSMDVDMLEFFMKKNKDFPDDPARSRVYGLLRQDLEATGERLELGGAELLVKPYHFEKKTDCIYAEGVTDPAALSDAELWRYIYGEYLVQGRLSATFKGLGSIQVPRDRARIREKYCLHATCDNCDRQGTERCHSLER